VPADEPAVVMTVAFDALELPPAAAPLAALLAPPAAGAAPVLLLVPLLHADAMRATPAAPTAASPADPVTRRRVETRIVFASPRRG
jgi:hypothetical protein